MHAQELYNNIYFNSLRSNWDQCGSQICSRWWLQSHQWGMLVTQQDQPEILTFEEYGI